MVHSTDDYEMAVEASKILFSNHAGEALRRLDETTLLQVMEGVPQHIISLQAASEHRRRQTRRSAHRRSTRIPLKGEMRKMTQQGGLSVNKEKATDPYATVTVSDLLNGKYLLVQRGKKNYFLLIAQ